MGLRDERIAREESEWQAQRTVEAEAAKRQLDDGRRATLERRLTDREAQAGPLRARFADARRRQLDLRARPVPLPPGDYAHRIAIENVEDEIRGLLRGSAAYDVRLGRAPFGLEKLEHQIAEIKAELRTLG